MTVSKPFFVRESDIDQLQVICPETVRKYADEVRENVPLFREHVSIAHLPARVTARGDVVEPSCLPGNSQVPEVGAGGTKQLSSSFQEKNLMNTNQA